MRWVEKVVRERVVSKSLCTGETNQRPLERTATYRPYPAGDVALSGSRPVNSEPKSAKSPISEKVGWLKVAGRLRSTKKCATCEERGSVKFDGLPAVALEAEQQAAQGST